MTRVTRNEPMPRLVDGVLERKDYVDHWGLQAKKHAQEQGWRGRIDEITNVVEVALGREWLEKQARQKERLPMVGMQGKHALGQMVALPSVENVARLLALGVYLRRCASISGFQRVVEQLRAGPQYEGGELQLGLAYRLLRLGIRGVELEPDVDKGRKCDLAFDLEGATYLVECYQPCRPRFAEYEELLRSTSTRIYDLAAEQRRRLIVHIQLREMAKLSAHTRIAIEQDVRRLLPELGPRDVKLASGDGYELEVFGTTGVEESEVRTISKSLETWASIRQCERSVSDRDVPEVHRTGKTDSPARSWIISTRLDAQAELEKECDRLAESLSEKVAQLRRGETKGVFAVLSPIAGAFLENEPAAKNAVEQVFKKILAKRPHVDAVWLLDSGTDERHRPRLGGVLLAREQGSPMGKLVERMHSLDGQGDALDDPDIDT